MIFVALKLSGSFLIILMFTAIRHIQLRIAYPGPGNHFIISWVLSQLFSSKSCLVISSKLVLICY